MRGMQQDFSWKQSAKEYVKMYNSIFGRTDDVEEAKPQPELVATQL